MSVIEFRTPVFCLDWSPLVGYDTTSILKVFTASGCVGVFGVALLFSLIISYLYFSDRLMKETCLGYVGSTTSSTAPFPFPIVWNSLVIESCFNDYILLLLTFYYSSLSVLGSSIGKFIVYCLCSSLGVIPVGCYPVTDYSFFSLFWPIASR